MKYKLSFSTGPPTYIMKFSFNSGIKSNVEYGDFLFKIKPTVPNLRVLLLMKKKRLKKNLPLTYLILKERQI